MNKAIIIGHVGKKPEVKAMKSGKMVCNFSVATQKTWNDKNGERQQKTEWHRITTWDKLAENCGRFVDKGMLVGVEGEIQTREYEADGVKKFSTEILASSVQFLSKSKDESPRNEAPSEPPNSEDYPF